MSSRNHRAHAPTHVHRLGFAPVTTRVAVITLALLAAMVCDLRRVHAESEPLQDNTEDPLARIRVAVGLAFRAGPNYAGSAAATRSVAPGVRITWRGYTISSSFLPRGILPTGDPGSGPETGITGPAARLDRSRLDFGFALRRDRTVSDADRRIGLRALSATLVGRARYRYDFTPDLTLSATLSADLLNQRGGLELPITLSSRVPLMANLVLHTDVGLTFANADAIDNDFGIDPDQSRLSGLPLYQPRAGLRDINAGVALTWQPDANWVLHVRSSASLLTGDAAHSPLVHRRLQPGVLAGMAYLFSW